MENLRVRSHLVRRFAAIGLVGVLGSVVGHGTAANAFSGERLVRRELFVAAVSADGSKALLVDMNFGEFSVVGTKVGGKATPVPTPFNSKLTADGRRIVFATGDSLVPTDKNHATDVYSYEVATKTYRNLTAGFPAALRTKGWELSRVVSIDADASRIAISAGNESMALHRVIVYDVPARAARFPDSRLAGAAATRNQSDLMWLSADGSVAVWNTRSTGGAWANMYRYSWSTNSARLVSKTSTGRLIPGGVHNGQISPDGRYALFAAKGAGIAGGGTPVDDALYRVDMATNKTVRLADRVSVGDRDDSFSISRGGTYIAYSRMLRLKSGAIGPLAFVRNHGTGVVYDLGQPNPPARADGPTGGVIVAANGHVVVFHSYARNFGPPSVGGGGTFIARVP